MAVAAAAAAGIGVVGVAVVGGADDTGEGKGIDQGRVVVRRRAGDEHVHRRAAEAAGDSQRRSSRTRIIGAAGVVERERCRSD